MQEKRWRLKEQGASELIEALVHDRCPETVARLLVQRGITDPENAAEFFRPSIDQLHDPFLMKDMGKAVGRIERALGEGQRIMVYGDYDVDGTTSVSMMYSFLSRLTDNVQFYIPDRYAEGYGVSTAGIDKAHKDGVALIITLDCGIKAIDKVAYAKEKGIDMIICDHHTPGEHLPDAVAVLDPKRADCEYPYKELCGCGVGFKLISAFGERCEIPFEELEDLLDLVAVAIACDIVALTGENRVLTYLGLERINTNPRLGFQTMIELSGTRKTELSITDLVFMIGPRINAAGRIQHAHQAVELLLATDVNEAQAKGLKIDHNNALRKDLDSEITDEALRIVEGMPDQEERYSNVLFKADWHKGVIGIVASRVIEHHYKPTIILAENKGMATGSARSVKGYNVYDAIDACRDLLEQFGGHKYAAGLTMKVENIDAFRIRFEEAVRKTMPEDLRIPQVGVDMVIDVDEINDRFIRIIDAMAPFGPQNMRPVFLLKGVLASDVRLVGEDHLKFAVRNADSAKYLQAIAFRQAEMRNVIESGEPFSLLCVIEFNDWNGRRSIQLNVKDIKAGIVDLKEAEVKATAIFE